MRGASARQIAAYALYSKQPAWLAAARPELIVALGKDPTAVDMLSNIVVIDGFLGNYPEAQFYYTRLKLVGPKSPVIRLVEQAHQSQAAVAGEP